MRPRQALFLTFLTIFHGTSFVRAQELPAKEAAPRLWKPLPRVQSSWKELVAPDILISLSIAGIMSLNSRKLDYKVSNWARRETPVFGSQSRARDAGDFLLGLNTAQAIVTSFLPQSGNSFGESALNKTTGLLSLGLIHLLSNEATKWGKRKSQRQRPNGIGNDSFPSLHTSATASLSAMSVLNLEYLFEQKGHKGGSMKAMRYVNLLGVMAVGWARIEGNRHYPSDVLVGYALGKAITRFGYRLLIGEGSPRESWRLSLIPSLRNKSIGLAFKGSF